MHRLFDGVAVVGGDTKCATVQAAVAAPSIVQVLDDGAVFCRIDGA